jgi:PAS domain S-box-containing protein
MNDEGRRPRIALYAVGSMVAVLTLLAAAWIAVDSAARDASREFAQRTRELEVSIAANAMAESFLVSVNQSKLIAAYSFPEYFRGLRDETSMRRLLETQRLQMPEILANAYFDEHERELLSFAGNREADTALVSSAKTARSWFSAHEEPYIVAYSDRETIFAFYHPVSRDGSLAGTFACAVDLGPATARYLSPLEGHSGRRAYLVGMDGRILWSSKPEDRGLPFKGTSVKGEAIAEKSFELGKYGFRVVAIDDEAALRAEGLPARSLRNMVFGASIASLAALAAMAFGLVISERRRRSLLEAEKRLEAVAAEREKALVASELRYETLFVRASDAIVLMDVTGKILRCNPRTALTFACGERGLVGKRPLDLSPPMQGAKPSAEALAEFMQLGRDRFPEPISFEWRLKRADGTEFDAEMSLSIIEAEGTRYVQAILRDVTERKRELLLLRESLEEREVILRELHHRVKNNLQYVQSLIGLQRDSATPEADRALAKIQDRVSALALAYLAAADRPETLIIDAPVYLLAICDDVRNAAILEDTRLDISLECEGLPIGLDAAISLGLILRELLDNAAQHGYGPGGEGPVQVSFSRSEGGAVLSVRDRGSGPAEGWRDGLGHTLARALASQLSGSLELSVEKPGFSAILAFPLA